LAACATDRRFSRPTARHKKHPTGPLCEAWSGGAPAPEWAVPGQIPHN
jgi:hypothetical protein